ncbi:MAG TPA: ATP synthase F0 subunit B [Terriglobales bacterium]|nr:ATP synthase F0 subunit B [Terriglobales bacterium]
MDKILSQLGELLLGAVPTVILLLMLIGLYKGILHNKLVEVLKERRARTEGAVQKAKADLAAAEAKTAEYEGRLREAKMALYKAQEERRKKVMEVRGVALAHAREQAEEQVKRARGEIERDVQAARAQLGAEGEKLAAEILRVVLAPAGARTPAAGGGR